MNMYRKCLLFLLVLLISCEGIIFHEEDDVYLVLDKEQEKVDMLNGIYYHLVKVHNEDYFLLMSRADDVNYYWRYGFLRCSSNPRSNIDFNPMINEIYLHLYGAILNASQLIGQLNEAQDSAIIGEACFLRAYCYFKLARLFGTPPLVKDIDVNYFIKKPTYTEVYEFMEVDMLKALELLPETYTHARIPGETPHKGTAKALLAEIYLAMAGFPVNDASKYAEAARLSSEVIEQADFYNYVLLDDFANLWKTTHRYNSENIFGLFYSSENNETRHNFGSYSQIKYYGLSYYVYTFDIRNSYTPGFKFFNDYPNNYRKINSLVTGEYVFNTKDDSLLYFSPYNPLYNACDFLFGAVYLKWIDIDDFVPGYYYTHVWSTNTLYLLRYAHTVLTYAEAKARAGYLDASCYEALNRIRRRANNVDIYSPSDFDLTTGITTEQFLDSVVWERAWELCFEPDGRWFDIIRLDLKDKIQEYRYSNERPHEIHENYLTDDWYFYRIPQHDRWLNPNFKLDND